MLSLTFKLYPQFASSPTALMSSTSFRMEVCKIFNFLYTAFGFNSPGNVAGLPRLALERTSPTVGKSTTSPLDRLAITAAFLLKKGHQIELFLGSTRVHLTINCSPSSPLRLLHLRTCNAQIVCRFPNNC